MKKILLMALCFLYTVPVMARIAVMDEKNKKQNELYVDEHGLYRYKKGEDIYKWDCMDVYQKEAKKKCMDARKAIQDEMRVRAENQVDDTLFTGKIRVHSRKGEDSYFYVEDGVKGKQIYVQRQKYYYEKNQAGKYVLYDLTDEKPYTGELVLGTVAGLSPVPGYDTRFVVSQRYNAGLPVGDPISKAIGSL